MAHFNSTDSIAHVDTRGPTHKGSLTGGAKFLFLFRLPRRLNPSHGSFSLRPRLTL
jgi:hypothetical protein